MNALYIGDSGITNRLIQSQVIPYIKELSKKGINFYLLSFEHRNIKRYNKIREELNKYKIKWHILRHLPWLFYPKSLLNIIRGIFYVYYLVRHKDINIIHTRSYIPCIIACIVKNLFTSNIKIIFDMRGPMIDEYMISGFWKKNSIKYILGKYIERFLIYNSDKIVVVSEGFKTFVENMGNKNKIAVIHACVATKPFMVNKKEEKNLSSMLKSHNKFILTYCGFLTPYFSIGRMLDFFIVLKKSIPNSHFLILTPQVELVKNIVIAYQKNIENGDYTAIEVVPKDVPKYLSLSTAGICFSSYNYKLSFLCLPIKLAEYLASGLLVIVNKELLEMAKIIKTYKVGVVVDKMNENGYRKAVLELLLLLEDKELKLRCRKLAEEKFSLEYGVNEYFKIYYGIT